MWLIEIDDGEVSLFLNEIKLEHKKSPTHRVELSFVGDTGFEPVTPCL